MNNFSPFSDQKRPLVPEDPRILQVDQVCDLSRITDALTTMVIWNREVASDLTDWIDAMDPSLLPKTRAIVAVHRVAEAVEGAYDAAGTPVCAERSLLTEDIVALAGQLAAITQAPHVRIRLDAVSGDACRRFHVDAMMARLICTYRGPGTEYGFAEAGEEPGKILSVPTGAPAVMRGLDWPAGAPEGVVHRSPPIAGSGIVRLVLAIDPVFDPDEET